MQSFLFVLLWTLAHPVYSKAISHENAERDYKPAYAHLATGQLLPQRLRTRAPWPVSVLSIGNTNASYQYYGSGAPYFHHGLDIRSNAGNKVKASVGGKVINIENYMPGPAYWEIAILDEEGFIWQYHHIDNRSIPQAVWSAFRNGGRVKAGDILGQVYYWPIVSFGERYHHIHLNILGAQKKYLSPFEFLTSLNDKVAPDIRRVFLVQNGSPFSGSSVSGSYTIAAEIADQVLHPRFVNPPHQLKIKIDNEPEELVWQFTALPGGASNTQFVHDYFVNGLACGNYECRKPIIDLSFRPKDKTALSGGSHKKFPATPGKHELKIIATDYDGNAKSATFQWRVR